MKRNLYWFTFGALGVWIIVAPFACSRTKPEDIPEGGTATGYSTWTADLEPTATVKGDMWSTKGDGYVINTGPPSETVMRFDAHQVLKITEGVTALMVTPEEMEKLRKMFPQEDAQP